MLSLGINLENDNQRQQEDQLGYAQAGNQAGRYRAV